jgi:hypothetical protein
MAELLERRDQEDIVSLIESSGFCNSVIGRRTFITEINLRPQEYLVEVAEHDFLVNLINLLVQTRNQEALRLILKKIAPSCDRHKIRKLENRLDLASYEPFSPTAKPAYFVDSRVFQLMPLDIGTIWGLQRSSFIGLLIGFERTEIYENLKNVEFALSQAIEVNKKANDSATILPKREWIRLDIDDYPGVFCQKSQIVDAAVDISNEVAKNLENNSFLNSTILGFFFEIDAKRIHTGCSERIRSWCDTLLNQLFPSQSVAIVINVIHSLDENVDHNVETIKTQLAEMANFKQIPIEWMRLDYRLFFAKIMSAQKTEYGNSFDIEEKPGLAFCSWMYHTMHCSLQSRKLGVGQRYREVIALHEQVRRRYSEEEMQNIYSKITELDIVLDVKAVTPEISQELYEQLLKIIVNFIPQCSREWISAYVKSGILEAVRAAFIIATHADFYSFSDILMDAWVNAIDIETFDIDILDQDGVLAPDFDNINNLKLEGLFLAFLRMHREQVQSNQKIQPILQKLKSRSPSLQRLYNFCQNANENDFLAHNDPSQFTLAIRADVKFEQAISHFKAAPLSHLPSAICWLLAAISPSQKNIAQLLQLEPIKRAVFGLCTPQEWQQIKKRQENERQVLDCRRERLLIIYDQLLEV